MNKAFVTLDFEDASALMRWVSRPGAPANEEVSLELLWSKMDTMAAFERLDSNHDGVITRQVNNPGGRGP